MRETVTKVLIDRGLTSLAWIAEVSRLVRAAILDGWRGDRGALYPMGTGVPFTQFEDLDQIGDDAQGVRAFFAAPGFREFPGSLLAPGRL